MKKNSFILKILGGIFLLVMAGCQNSVDQNTLKENSQTQFQNTESQTQSSFNLQMVPSASQEMQGDQGSQGSKSIVLPEDQAYRDKLLAGRAKSCIDEKDEGKIFGCYETFLKNAVGEGGPELAFKDLKILYEVAPIVQSYCHPLTHAIGHAAVDKYPLVSEAYKHGDSYCWSGYYHGVMEQVSKNIGRKNLPQKLNEICNDIPGKDSYSFDYYNCVHGLGHGVMAITNNQLFDSLKLCDNLQDAWEQESCYGGVYMENVIIDNLNHHTDYLKPSEPLYPCTAVEYKYKSSCYLMQTSYALKTTQHDYQKVFELCEHADKGFEITCYQSLGRDASGSSISNVEKTKQKCFLGKNYTQKSECIVGAVKDFISYFHSDVQGKNLCNALGDTKMTQYCLDTATAYYKNF